MRCLGSAGCATRRPGRGGVNRMAVRRHCTRFGDEVFMIWENLRTKDHIRSPSVERSTSEGISSMKSGSDDFRWGAFVQSWGCTGKRVFDKLHFWGVFEADTRGKWASTGRKHRTLFVKGRLQPACTCVVAGGVQVVPPDDRQACTCAVPGSVHVVPLIRICLRKN